MQESVSLCTRPLERGTESAKDSNSTQRCVGKDDLSSLQLNASEVRWL